LSRLSRWSARGAQLAVALAASLLLAATLAGSAGAAGFQAQSYAGFGAESTGGAVTGQKPESKLWFNDGSWWAAMVSPAASGAHTIHRLVGTSWQDTGVLIDARSATKEDVLSLGSTLYILSRSAGGTAGPSQLRRFTYAAGTYTLDPGFPVVAPGTGAEATTLARDSTGTLWVAYEAGTKVWVAHTLGSDTTWGAPFVLPVANATGLKADDISAVIAFQDATGPAIGVMWSNQNTQSDYFAIHRDGAADSAWSVETALSGPLQADDHINLKTAGGAVYAAVKTSVTGSTEALIKLLVRYPTGSWAEYPVATYAERNTRPLVLVDPTARRLYVFMTLGATNPRGIVYKASSLDSIAFPDAATPFIDGTDVNDPTSTKQNVDAGTGIVVLASDGSSYWWNSLALAGPNTAPTAQSASASTSAGTPVTITLLGGDAETCELSFAVVSAPAHGSLGPIAGAPCAPGSPNTDTAMATYTPAGGFQGTDSFTFQVSDGQLSSAPATVTVTVSPPGPVVLHPTSVSVKKGTLLGGDVGSLAADDGAYLDVGSTTGQSPTAAWYGSFTGVPGTISSLDIAYSGQNSAPAAQTITIWNWTASKWVTLDSRTVGTTEIRIDLTVASALADYVSPSGEVRVKVASSASSPFVASGDLLEISYLP